MTIENGYYVADCTSVSIPVARKNGNTFYLPINISKDEDTGIYEYEEYRFNLPINYQFPLELLEYMAYSLDEYRKALQDVGVV